MIKLGIVDIREIVRILKDSYGHDLSAYALTSLKYRLENNLNKYNIRTVENFFRKLGDEPNFTDLFIGELLAPSTEMFRDPSLWRWLRESHFMDNNGTDLTNYKIWLPLCVSGAELYTLAIVLKECGLLNKVKIYATYFSDHNLDFIQSGEYPMKKIEVSQENYRRYQGKEEFSDYYQISNGTAIRNKSLIERVEFIKDDISYAHVPKNIKLVLYRNTMIYFNPTLQSKVLNKIYQSLSVKGLLAIGIKEAMSSSSTDGYAFEPANINESVYKRKVSG